MKRKLAFLTALIMGMSAVSVTNVVDSKYITASAETTTPELPELKKGEARVILTDYDTGEIIQFENADDEKRIVSMYADIRYRNMNDTGGDWVSTGPIYIIKSNPYYCDIAKFLDADFFDVSLPTNNLPEGYSLPDDYKVITKNDNGSLEIEFRLKKAPEIIKEGRLVGCDTSDIFFTLDSEGTLTLSGKGETPCHLDIAYDKRVKKLVIKEGITGISLESLIFPNLESVVFPESLDYIGYCGIGGKFKEITIPDSMVGGIDPEGFCQIYEDFTVVGYENTYAKVFADSVGCSFKSLGEAERRIVRTGALCENVNYDIYNTLELVISGSGVIKDCDWYSRSDKSIAGSAVKKLTIEEGITSISDCVAPGCSNLTEVILPDSLTSIDGAAFYECTGLTEITIPKNVTSIGDYTFLECKRLKTIKGYKGTYAETYAKENGYEFVALEEEPVTIIKTGKVEGCDVSNLTYTLDSEGTLTISGKGDMPCHTNFSDDRIKKIVIEDGVTFIGMEDFICENLETVELPAECGIDSFAFGGCPKLKEIYIPDTITGGISDTAFGKRDKSFTVIGYDNTYAQLYAEQTGCTFKSLGEAESKLIYSDSLGENITYSCYSTLNIVISGNGKMNEYNYETTPLGYTSIKSVTIEDGVSNIADGLFTECKNLTQITLPDSLTSIGESSFYGCTGLTEITIPENVTTIGKTAFMNCDNLKTIKGYKGSYAEKYAEENGFEFISLGSVPVTTTTTSEQNVSLIGDANCDGDVNMADAVLVMQSLANPDKYGITGADATHITEHGMKNADVNGEGVTNSDALEIQKYMLKLIEDFE